MRRHEKASTAGSTQRQAKGLGRFFCGADTTRDASLDSKGSSAPAATFSSALLVALFSLVAFAASASAAAPAIPTTTVSAVTSKAAVLEADVNPEGEATTYHFEYGLADCGSNPCTSVPIPNGNVGSGSAAVRIKKEVLGLSADTTYHFRAVATNGSGATNGPDRSFTTYPSFAPNTNCPNQAFRIGPAVHLADCRAYEMVSPDDKNGGDIAVLTTAGFNAPRQAYNQAAIGGGKFTYSSGTSFGDQLSARGSNQYMATRGAGGWTSHGINAPLGSTLEEPTLAFFTDLYTQFKMFTPDLSSAWITDGNKNPLTPDAAKGFVDLYRRDNLTDSYEALTTSVPTTAGAPYIHGLGGRSSDSSDVVFEIAGALTPDAAATPSVQLYDYSEGELHLVSVRPDGTAAQEESKVGRNTTPDRADFGGMVNHAVSDDGSRIFWTEGESPGGGLTIYVRENPTQPQSALNGSNECTEAAKACTKVVASSGGIPNRFSAASADGSKVIYTSGQVLKEFDVDTEVTTTIAGEVGGVVGASDDASYVYFTSKESLDAGATAGEWNLYLRHGGAVTFIATLSEEDRVGELVGEFPQRPGGIDSDGALQHAARVTPDGRHLAFMSNRSLTGYDNTDAVNGKADREVFLYDAGSDELTCASCNPSGTRPVGKELLIPYARPSLSEGGGQGTKTYLWAAAWLQTLVHTNYASRALSNDGRRLFFNSFDALVPGDTNGAQDVYQWEAQGSGSCQKPGGCVSLISTGTSPEISEFVDATPDGSEAFFETASSIDPRDPGQIDIYSARIDGGFPLPQEPPECAGDACQSIPTGPNDATPASAAFRGAGNPVAQKQRCRASNRKAGKHHAKQKKAKAKRCRRAKRGAGR